MSDWFRVRWQPLIFLFQAVDGIRDVAVTGVQTCALPILSWSELQSLNPQQPSAFRELQVRAINGALQWPVVLQAPSKNLRVIVFHHVIPQLNTSVDRSEERRVGKESRDQEMKCNEMKK